MIDSIALANGQSYTFQYDQAGRITHVGVPTGGTYTYSYPGPINCNSFRGMAEETAVDRTIDGITTSFRKVVGGTQVTFPNGSVVTHYIDPYSGYEVGMTGNGVTTHICWWTNGTSFCNAGQAPPLGIFTPGQNKATQTINTEDNSTSNTLETFDFMGNLIDRREYDYSNSNVNAPDRRTVTTFESPQPHTAAAPLEVQIFDHGILISDTKYQYNQTATIATQPAAPQHLLTPPFIQPRNLTETDRWVGGTTWIPEYRTYFDTGNVAFRKDANLNITGFAYSACGSSFMTQVTYPGSVSESKAWECNSAQPASVTDQRGVVTNYTYADPAFSRVTRIDRPADGASTWFTYNDNALNEQVRQRISSTAGTTPGQGWTNAYSIIDDLNRASRALKLNGQGTWDTTDTTYDNMGNVSFVSAPYAGAGLESTKQTSGTGTVNIYDSFNRLSQMQYVHDGITDVKHTTPFGRDYSHADESGKQLIERKDWAGRVVRLCEVTGNPSDPDCGMGIAGKGFVTTQGFNALEQLTTVNQGSQQRVFQYDGLGRVISQTEPESGLTRYVYDTADAACGSYSHVEAMVEAIDAAGTATCMQYDPLNRLTSRSYSGGQTPTDTFTFTGAFLTSASNTSNAVSYGYASTGTISSVTEAIPNVGSFATAYVRNLLNQPIQIGLPNGPTLCYVYDDAGGRWT